MDRNHGIGFDPIWRLAPPLGGKPGQMPRSTTNRNRRQRGSVELCKRLDVSEDGGISDIIDAGLAEIDYDVTVIHRPLRRPDSYYGTSKSFGEDLGRYYVENYDAPTQFYALRICNVRHEM